MSSFIHVECVTNANAHATVTVPDPVQMQEEIKPPPVSAEPTEPPSSRCLRRRIHSRGLCHDRPHRFGSRCAPRQPVETRAAWEWRTVAGWWAHHGPHLVRYQHGTRHDSKMASKGRDGHYVQCRAGAKMSDATLPRAYHWTNVTGWRKGLCTPYAVSRLRWYISMRSTPNTPHPGC